MVCGGLWSLVGANATKKVRDTDSDYVMRKPSRDRGAGSAPFRDTGTLWQAVFVSLVLLKTPLLP